MVLIFFSLFINKWRCEEKLTYLSNSHFFFISRGEKNRSSILGLVPAGLAIYAACRKIDFESSKEKAKINPEEKFFNPHKATNPVIGSLAAFMKRENDRLHFVGKTITQLGYPY